MRRVDRIIFVAKSGNCREVMAAEILKAILEEHQITNPPAILARGLIVHFPEPLNPKAEVVLSAKLQKFTPLVSKSCTAEVFSSNEVTENTLVLVMETAHFKKLHDLYPEVDLEQVEVLSEYVGDELEIVNPYGGQLANYGLCYENLRRSLEKLINKLYGTQSEE